MRILRRTFAAKHADAAAREIFNKDPLTSEYSPSYKYLIREPHPLSPPNQPYFNHTFRTKGEAETWLKTMEIAG